MKIYQKEIYPPELSLTADGKNDQVANYLDLHIEIKNNIHFSLYDKRDNFDFLLLIFLIFLETSRQRNLMVYLQHS